MAKLEIQMLAVSELVPYANNPRKNKKAINSVAKSIKDFGFRVPIVVDENKVIVCGHTRYEACKKLGMKKVPCIMADDLNEEQVKAFRLVDNNVAAYSTWDEDALAAEIEELGIDMAQYGFGIDKALKAGEEIDVDEFDDEQFKYTCPCCGLKFN